VPAPVLRSRVWPRQSALPTRARSPPTGRQGGPARLLRRPGDEGAGRQGRRPRRQRAGAREARRL